MDEKEQRAHRERLEAEAERTDIQAKKAERLLEDPLLAAAMRAHSTGVHQLWENTQPEETEKRERLWFQLHAGHVFEAYLQRTISAGKVAAVAAAQVADGSTGNGKPGRISPTP